MKLKSRAEFLKESLNVFFDYNDVKETCDEFDRVCDMLTDLTNSDKIKMNDTDSEEFKYLKKFYVDNSNTTYTGVTSGKIKLSKVESDTAIVKWFLIKYGADETEVMTFGGVKTNEGIVQTLKDSLPKIKIPSGNLWPQFAKDIKDGKIKRDTLGGLLPQVVNDIASGKLKDQALTDLLPPIIEDIKSGKMKREAIDKLPPQFVKDIKSGKVTADIIGKRPEVLGKIKNMFI